MRLRERGIKNRERERARPRDSKTDRQADRQADRLTKMKRGRQHAGNELVSKGDQAETDDVADANTYPQGRSCMPHAPGSIGGCGAPLLAP